VGPRAFEQRETVAVRQRQVEHDEVHAALFKVQARFSKGMGREGVEASPAEDEAQRFQERRLVIDQEHAGHGRILRRIPPNTTDIWQKASGRARTVDLRCKVLHSGPREDPSLDASR
jgi:hypothetical protein